MQAIPIFLEEEVEFNRLLGAGAFNNVYLSKNDRYVFKQPKMKSPLTEDSTVSLTDIPENAVAVWNSINGEKLGEAKVVQDPYYGWFCPYVSGKKPTGKEAVNEIIHIYAATKRILYDAHHLENFVKRTSDKKIFCIDLGLAIVPSTIRILSTDKEIQNTSFKTVSSSDDASHFSHSESSTFSAQIKSIEINIEKCLAAHIARMKNSSGEEASVAVLALEYLSRHYPLASKEEIEKLAQNEKLLHALKNAYLFEINKNQLNKNLESEYLYSLGLIYHHFHSPIFSENPHEEIFHVSHSNALQTELISLKKRLILSLKHYIKINKARSNLIHNEKLSFSKSALAIRLLSVIQNALNKEMILDALKSTIQKNKQICAYFTRKEEEAVKTGEFGLTLQKMLEITTETEQEREGDCKKL